MPIPSFRRVRSDSTEVRQLQDATDFVFQGIRNKQILDGLLIEGVAINGSLVVEHKLARPLVGYIVVKNSANATIWDSQTSNTTPSMTLVLNSSGATTISLWVF